LENQPRTAAVWRELLPNILENDVFEVRRPGRVATFDGARVEFPDIAHWMWHIRGRCYERLYQLGISFAKRESEDANAFDVQARIRGGSSCGGVAIFSGEGKIAA
jgi:hypothetical protein